ncbi:MAG: histidine phosphatase family protein, partial [Eggerthellaceae bacterium]|nr:histidine phosphatase family protein [Eggerthellaceae bacterium]
FNRRKIIQGWIDSPLTELGRAQAELGRDHLEGLGVSFDHAYCSTAERACDTAEIVTRGNIPYERCKGLRELNFGVLEGVTQDLLLPGPHANYGDYLVQFGGESMDAVGERMNACLTQIMGRQDHESVLAIAHGACTLAFNLFWLERSEVKIDHITRNCSIYTFEYDPADKGFNCVDVFEPDDSQLEGGGRVD